MPATRLRPGTATDLPFLEEMLQEAFFWDPAAPRLCADEARRLPEFEKLPAGWRRPGDRALIAVDAADRIGAAWFRSWTPEPPSYGFVDASTPELAIAVAPAHRSRGIGRSLLVGLLDLASQDGHPGLSLSVSPRNRALRLYKSLDFEKVGE